MNGGGGKGRRESGKELQGLLEEAGSDFRQGNLEGAGEMLNRLLREWGPLAEAYHMLGLIALQRGEREKARERLEEAVGLDPGVARYHYNLGIILQGLGDAIGAVSAYESVLGLDPGHGGAHNNLAAALRDLGQLTRAEAHLRKAVEIQPGNAKGWSNLGSVLRDGGRIHEALDAYRKALELDPVNAAAHSNLLLCLHYLEGQDRDPLFQSHRDWASRHARGIRRMTHDPRPCGRGKEILSVGYVSADFRTHSAAYFLKSLLLHHDRSRFDLHLFNAGSGEDPVTRWFRDLPVRWHDISCLDDEEAASRIYREGIHILVDCSGHTAGNRLMVFARRPAAVQVTWLGYPDTTGLPAMDYRITDRWADPVEDPTPSTETLFRLAGGFLCYAPPEPLPGVNPLPALERGCLTFGSFNTLPKLNSAVLDLWARLLLSVPDSRLLVKTRQFADPAVASSFRGAFLTRGVSEERVSALGPTPSVMEHLEGYHEVDVALDPFPYNGTTTTYEALVMGVPVITLKGKTHAGRVGTSILSRIGLGQLVADTPERYIAVAQYFQEDLKRLSLLRESLRAAVLAKNDCKAFAREMEAAYEEMWGRWERGTRNSECGMGKEG
ncbi:MAG: tetratricopeptide repeat protein [Thermodesulfobacteriota bacterium]